jgi:hypothetical protein
MGPAQFFGGLMIICGLLSALLCGLCTIAVIGVSVSAPVSHSGQNYGGGAMIPVALLLGGVPTAFGALMVWAGIALFRSRRTPQPPPPKPLDEPTGTQPPA